MLSKCISLNKAKWLFNKFNNMETSLSTVTWNTILERINRNSKELQSTSLDLNTAVILLKSLHSYIYKLRDEFNNFEKKAKQLCKLLNIHQKEQGILNNIICPILINNLYYIVNGNYILKKRNNQMNRNNMIYIYRLHQNILKLIISYLLLINFYISIKYDCK